MNTTTKTTTTATRTHRLHEFGCATLAGACAALVLGTPSWGMHRPSSEMGNPHDGPTVGIFTGGARPGAYLMVKTPML